jgi:transposase
MNIQLHNVISDITGDTSMKIIRAIIAGERNPKALASHRHQKCKNSVEIITKSLTGNYKNEHIFTLKQAVEIYDIYQEKITACDEQIEKLLAEFDDNDKSKMKQEGKARKVKKSTYCKNKLSFDVTSHLKRITGVDLTQIPEIEASTALKVISEIGLDLTRWHNSKQFASWLGLCPGNKVSGGKILNSRSKKTGNYASTILRMAASTIHYSKSTLGGFFRGLNQD